MLLLSGPPGAGKTRTVLSRLRDSVTSGAHDVLVLVPTATLAQHLQHELAREGVAFRRGNLTTLSRFSRRLTADVTEISSALLNLVTQQTIQRLDLPEFAAVADTRNFPTLLASTIAAFDAAGNSAPQVQRAFNRAGVRDNLAIAFLKVWSEVAREVADRGLMMRGTRLVLAAEKINRRFEENIRTICLDGFAALPLPELELIHAMAAHAEVIVTLPEAPHSPSVEAARGSLLRMGAVEQHLLKDSGSYTGVRKIVPETIEREAEEIARLILARHRDGVPLRRMGVAMRNSEAYRPLLETAFERFGIPARGYAGSPLLQHPAARFLAGLIDAAITGWDHEATIEALRFNPAAGASPDLDYLEIKARANYPARGLPELQALVNRPPRVIEQLAKLTVGFGATYSAKRWAERIGELRTLAAVNTVPDRIKDRDRVVYSGHAAVLNTLEDALVEAAALFGTHERIDLAQFWAAARPALEETTYRSRDDRREVVHLLSVQEARQWELDVVFLCGLVEKQFPRRHPQNALVSDAVLQQVAPEGVTLRTAEEHNAEESFLFTAALGAARVEAVLSYPRLDGRGQENPPSRFFGYLNEPLSETRAVQPARRTAGPSRAPVPGIQNPAVLQVLNNSLTRVSPSGLESFLKCPLQFFFGKTLRLQELPDLPGDRMNFLAQGSIAHQSLARWVKHSEPIGEVIDEEFDRYCAQHKVPSGYALEVARVNLRKALESFTREFRAHSGHPIETEQELVMVLDEHTSISGRADLIVHEEAGAVIYDYKYSKAKGTRDRVNDLSTMQAPIYVHALATTTGRFPAGMLYVDLKAGEEFGMAGWHTRMSAKFIMPLTPEWVSERMDAVRTSVAGIRAGTIAPAPNSAQTCKWCDFRHACRHAAAEAALTAGDGE